MRGNIVIVGLLCSVIIYGCGGGAATRQIVQTSDNRECIRNFITEGSFVSGRTFKTHQLVPNVSKSVAMERAARYLATDGWQINTIDKELGVISAAQPVAWAKGGKTAPLNVSIESVEGGINVSLSFSATSGALVRGELLKNTFCSIIKATEK